MTVSFYGSALSVLSHPTPEQETAVSNRSRDASQKSTQSRDSKFSAGEFFTGGGLKGGGLTGRETYGTPVVAAAVASIKFTKG